MKRLHLFAIVLIAILNVLKIGMVALFCTYHSMQAHAESVVLHNTGFVDK